MRQRLHAAVFSIVAMLLPCATLHAQQEQNADTREAGATFRIWNIGESMKQIPELIGGQTPNLDKLVTTFNFADQDFRDLGYEDYFAAEGSGFLRITKPGTYAFRLESDDGSTLSVDGKQIISNDGNHGIIAVDGTIELAAGDHPFVLKYFENIGEASLKFLWRGPGDQAFRLVDSSALVTQKGVVRVTAPGKKRILKQANFTRPGDGQPLTSVHPSFTLTQARPDSFHPRVGGMDFLPDGRLVVCSWDPEGAVYILSNLNSKDPEKIQAKLFAKGLAEPLGVSVVNNRIFVLQKQELTELIDTNNDGVADEYRALATGWPVSGNFHEFAFGLAHKDGYLYFAKAIAINPGGASTVDQKTDRGAVVKVDINTGAYESIANGLRTPNGIGVGTDGEVFLCDNQGDWLPANKLVHVVPGAFYGSHAVDPVGTKDKDYVRPAIWLVENEIGNSPSQPLAINIGPWKGQMIHGDVTHGGLKRDFLEIVDGQYQGCAFEFSQGLEAGVNRIAWSPDGGLYVGGIGSSGNWGQEGKKWYGLQRLSYDPSKITFEPLAVRAMTNGFEVEFTMPLANGLGWDPSEYFVEQFRFEPTAAYGGPKLDLTRMPVKSATVSSDRKKVFLEIPGLLPDHCQYLQMRGNFYSEATPSQPSQVLWTTMAWYTMNKIPKDKFGIVGPAPFAPHNTLSAEEKAQGFELLFDGTSLSNFKNFRKDTLSTAWQVVDGTMVLNGSGGDLVTKDTYDNFELRYDWRISPGGNSGVFFHVSEDPKYNFPWLTGPEMQVLDNTSHVDGKNPLTSAGSNYALVAPTKDVTLPTGAFNSARLIVNGSNVQHWLNGVKVVEYTLNSPEWKALVAKSKFNEMPDYAKYSSGVIGFQDHGDPVQYRNIKIRRIKSEK